MKEMKVEKATNFSIEFSHALYLHRLGKRSLKLILILRPQEVSDKNFMYEGRKSPYNEILNFLLEEPRVVLKFDVN